MITTVFETLMIVTTMIFTFLKENKKSEKFLKKKYILQSWSKIRGSVFW